MKKINLPVLICLTVFFTGCAHVFHVGIDAINAGEEIANKTYVIVPGDSNTEAGDLQFREFAMYLARALKINGYTAAAPNQAAEIEICLSYGIGSPQARVRTYTVPVWGQTGTDTTTNVQTVGNRSGTISNTVATTSVTPEYGVTGYTTQQDNYTVYPRYIEIDAYRIKSSHPGDKMDELWKTTLHSEGKRNEIRSSFPAMMAAGAQYLGGNTGREIEVAITADQAAVKAIKGIKE
jgi:hypothetical protein